MHSQNIKICEGVNLLCINDDKFKTSRISFTMFVPLEESTATVHSLLMGILERGCKEYPNFQSFNRYLEQLYGANIYSNVDKIGEVQALTLSAVCINDNLTFNNEEVLLNISKLLCSVIFEPCLNGTSFKNEDIIQAKRQLKENIKSEYNDKKIYSKIRCEELMCKGERFSINRLGKEEDIDSINSEDIFNAWKNLLDTARIEIMALGSIDSNTIKTVFSDAFAKVTRKSVNSYKPQIIDTVDKTREFQDVLDVVQCKLVMGFRTPYSAFNDNIFPVKLMTALLGGTPVSKLFMNVREKLSLCYYCAASFNKDKGILLIESGVERINLEMAKKEILYQLDEIKKGNFTDDELNNTKKYLSQAFEQVNDSLGAMNSWYISQVISGKIYTPKEYAENICNVSKKEVIEAANNVKLDTIYTLTGKEADK